MEIFKKVSFKEVEREFRKQYRKKNRPEHVSRWCLDWTELKVGNWYKVRLSHKDVLSILLPGHAHPNRHLIPDEGRLLRHVLQKKINYRTVNRTCWQSIKYFKTKDFNPLFLSTKFIALSHYRRLKYQPTALYHVDGIHRLVAWGLDGRYTDEYLEKHPLYAYVAIGRRFQFAYYLKKLLNKALSKLNVYGIFLRLCQASKT